MRRGCNMSLYRLACQLHAAHRSGVTAWCAPRQYLGLAYWPNCTALHVPARGLWYALSLSSWIAIRPWRCTTAKEGINMRILDVWTTQIQRRLSWRVTPLRWFAWHAWIYTAWRRANSMGAALCL